MVEKRCLCSQCIHKDVCKMFSDMSKHIGHVDVIYLAGICNEYMDTNEQHDKILDWLRPIAEGIKKGFRSQEEHDHADQLIAELYEILKEKRLGGVF